jgi:hypothetical protein
MSKPSSTTVNVTQQPTNSQRNRSTASRPPRRNRRRRRGNQSARNSSMAGQYRARVARSRATRGEPGLSACAQEYCWALSYPETCPISVCMPTIIPNTCTTFRVTTNSFVTIPALGGFVVFDPRRATVNDLACVAASNSTYTGGTTIRINSVATQMDLSFSNSTLSNAEYVADYAGINTRIIGAVLSIEYAGTTLNMGGVLSALHDPNHVSLHLRTPAEINGERRKFFGQVSRRRCRVLYYPAVQTDYELSGTAPSVNSNPGPTYTSTNSFYMGATINPSVDSVYMIKTVTLFEAMGRNIVAGARSTHAEPLAMGAAISAASNLNSSDAPPVTAYQSITNSVKSALGLASDTINLVNQARSIKDAFYGGFPYSRNQPKWDTPLTINDSNYRF